MGVFCTPVDRLSERPASNGVGADVYTVTADDRAWFARCHRAWDLGARGRQDLRRGPPLPSSRQRRPALLAALAVHYFPGMWTWDRAIVGPARACGPTTTPGGPPAGRRLLTEFQRWAPRRRRLHADPGAVRPRRPRAPTRASPTAHLAAADRRAESATASGCRWPSVDGDDRCWLVEHRVVDALRRRRRAGARRARAGGVLGVGRERARGAAGRHPVHRAAARPARRAAHGRGPLGRLPIALAGAPPRPGRWRRWCDADVDVDPTPAWSHCR